MSCLVAMLLGACVGVVGAILFVLVALIPERWGVFIVLHGPGWPLLIGGIIGFLLWLGVQIGAATSKPCDLHCPEESGTRKLPTRTTGKHDWEKP